MKFKKSILMVLPLSLGVVSIISCNSGTTFNERTVKLYMGELENANDQKLYFSSSYPGIPFIDLNDGTTFLKDLHTDKNYNLEVSKEGDTFTYKRENGATLSFYFNNNTVEMSNRNLFQAGPFVVTSLDSRSNDDSFYDEQGKKIEGEVRFNTIKTGGAKQYFETKAKPIIMLLDNYNIKTYKQGDRYLVPFTTFYNIAGDSSLACLYNGQDLFLAGQYLQNFSQAYKDKFYSFEKQERSKELVEYNYNEFVRDLDYTYGLSEEHGISSFYTFMEDNGLKDLLLSGSRYDEDKAYYELAYTFLADSHSGFTIPNAYGGEDATEALKIISEIPFDPAIIEKWNKGSQIKANRIKYNNIDKDGKVLNPIFVYGKSLIITFDHFVKNKSVDFYYKDEFKKNKTQYVKENPGDLIGLVSLANDMIHEDLNSGNPTIENVVIDLSGNGGGEADTAIFLLGWLDSAHMQLTDPISDYHGSVTYASDINFDKKIDENDYLLFSDPNKSEQLKEEGKAYKGKVYCLTSDSSFSCGNYVPAMLKQSGLVKLVGSKSGGGACVVHVTGTADGSGLSFSGNRKLCIDINGSFYSIDKGIEPDYPLNDFETLYAGSKTESTSDRSKLIEYLNSLK